MSQLDPQLIPGMMAWQARELGLDVPEDAEDFAVLELTDWKVRDSREGEPPSVCYVELFMTWRNPTVYTFTIDLSDSPISLDE